MIKISCCWLYAISKYGYPPSIENTGKAIKEIRRLGFRFAELEGVGEKNLLAVSANRRELKEICDGEGVEVVNFCPVLPQIVSLDEKERRKGLDLFKIGVELANFFGASTIQTDSYAPPFEYVGEPPYKCNVSFGQVFKAEVHPDFDWEKQWDAMVDSYRACAEMAEKSGLKFCLEPRVGEMISNTDSLLRLIDHVDHANLGAVLDTAHLNAQYEFLVLSIEKLRGRIFYVHAADNDGSDNRHLALGDGNIDWDGIAKGLRKHGFSGAAAIDVGRIDDLDEAMVRSKRFLEDLFEKEGLEFES